MVKPSPINKKVRIMYFSFAYIFWQCWVTALLWAVAPRNPLLLFYSTKIANIPKPLLFNPEPELLPIAIVVHSFYWFVEYKIKGNEFSSISEKLSKLSEFE